MSAIVAAAVPACSWMMVKPPDDGARGPRAVCTDTTFYEHVDDVYGAVFALVAAVSVPAFLDPDRPAHDMSEVVFPATAILGGALLWSGASGARDTARCRAVHAQVAGGR